MVYVLRPGTAHRTSPSVFAPHPSLCAVLQHGGFVEHPQQGHLFFFCQLGIVDADLSHQDIHLLFQRGTFKLLRIFKLLPRLLDGCAVRRGLIGPMCRFDLLQDRRQLILTTKDKPADRTDDPFLVEKMCAELEGILLWCLEGLHRLVQNDFRFTVSERAAANVDTIKRSSNNVIDFMESEGYFRFKADYSISSKEFYDIYKQWCEDNACHSVSAIRFSAELRQNDRRYNLEATNNIYLPGGRRVRGFVGIEPLVHPCP